MTNELPDILWQWFAFPKDTPRKEEEDATHPGMMGISEGELLPMHCFEISDFEDAIYMPRVDSEFDSPR